MLVFKEVVNSHPLYGVWLEARCDQLDESAVELAKGLEKQANFQIYRVTATSEYLIGSTSMSPMPGCCGIVVSHFTKLTLENQGKGLSNPYRSLKENLAKALGYGLMIATTDMANFPAVGNMFKSKYNMIESFINPRTGHLVGVGVKKVKKT